MLPVYRIKILEGNGMKSTPDWSTEISGVEDICSMHIHAWHQKFSGRRPYNDYKSPELSPNLLVMLQNAIQSGSLGK